MTVTAVKTDIPADIHLLEPVDGPMTVLRDKLGDALHMREYYVREAREAEAELAHITARVQKRKDTVAKYDASILEMRIKAHMAGMDRSFGKDLMGQ